MIDQKNSHRFSLFLVKISLATLLLQSYNCNSMNKLMDNKKNIGFALTTAGVGLWTANDLENKFSKSAIEKRSNLYVDTLKKNDAVNRSVESINKVIDQELQTNIRGYNFLSFFIDKNFIDTKKSKKNKLKPFNDKAIKQLLQPTINNIENIIGNTAIVAGPIVGMIAALKAKKVSKDPRKLIPKLIRRTGFYGVGGGLVTNAITDYIDNNPEQIINLGMLAYKKHEDLVLKEVQAVSRNGLQASKEMLNERKSLFHLLIRKNPLLENKILVIDQKKMKEICGEYYDDLINTLTPNFLKKPILTLPITSNVSIKELFADAYNDDNDKENKRKKNSMQNQEPILIIIKLNDN